MVTYYKLYTEQIRMKKNKQSEEQTLKKAIADPFNLSQNVKENVELIRALRNAGYRKFISWFGQIKTEEAKAVFKFMSGLDPISSSEAEVQIADLFEKDKEKLSMLLDNISNDSMVKEAFSQFAE